MNNFNHQIDYPAYPNMYAKPSRIQQFFYRRFITPGAFFTLISSLVSLAIILLIYINA